MSEPLSEYFVGRRATLTACAVPVWIDNYAKARIGVLSSDVFCNFSNLR